MGPASTHELNEAGKSRIAILLLVIVVYALLDDSDAHKCCCCCRSGPQITSLLTFNAFLFDYVPKRKERRNELVKYLQQKKRGAHVVCLQEVWSGEDVEKIVTDLKFHYPFSYSQLHETVQHIPSQSRQTLPALCRGSQFTAYHTCYTTYCGSIDDTSGDGLNLVRGCLLQFCLPLIFQMKQKCISCLFFTLPSKGLEKCGTDLTGYNQNISGLLLLSKSKLGRARVVDFPPKDVTRLAKRSYIATDVDGVGPTVCTHQTTALLPDIYVEGGVLPFTSYAEQSMNETREVLNAFDDSDRLVVMGDLNTGPAIPELEIVAELPDSYAEYTRPENGFSPRQLNQCTWCTENTFPGKEDRFPPESNFIDHILVRGHRVLHVQRVLDDNDHLSTPDLPIPAIPLSDHYGTKTLIVPACTQ